MYLAPQRYDVARLLFTRAARKLGWYESADVREPPGNPRGTALGLWLAREYLDAHVEAKLRRHVEAHHEPIWDTARGEFTWGFGLGEAYPRGQFNATSAAAEAASPRAWWRIYNEPKLGKFAEPTVVGVDFPRVALRQAWWDGAARQLVISLAHPVESDDDVPSTTTLRVTGLVDARRWRVTDPTSRHHATWQPIDGDLMVTLPCQPATYVVHLS